FAKHASNEPTSSPAFIPLPFRSTPVNGADHYYIWISDLTSGTNLTNPNVLGTSWTPSNPLIQGHSYRWWIQAANSNGVVSPWSNSLDFATPPLARPVLIGPAGLTTNAMPTCTWTAVAGANHYYIWISDLTSGTN